MPTYEVTLKDKDKNVILPKTRSTLVYTNKEETLERELIRISDTMKSHGY